MSAILLVIKDRKQVAKAAIAGDLFIIGRSPQCDLPIEESLASRQHLEIIREQGSYFVRDRGSRNGTTVNGERITDRRRLKDGDDIGVGSTNLKFVSEGEGDGQSGDDEATRLASFSRSGESAPGQKVGEKSAKGPLDVKLRVVDGPLSGGTFRNWDGPLLIGRGLENHVVLLDDSVSSRHARIAQEGDKYFIDDLRSANGTFLDGVKVQRGELQNGQKIKIGVSTLVFDKVDLRKQRRTLRISLVSVASILAVAALIKFLQPPDIAGQHISTARSLDARGDFEKSSTEFELALRIDPGRDEAKRGLALVKNEVAARDALAQAEIEAGAERYDKAKDLVYRVLRDFPSMPRAIELEAVIKSIEDAKVAFLARNWSDAKQLLQNAQQAYPKSELIRSRLELAESELAAQQSLSQAMDALRSGNLDAAEAQLQSIPQASVYFDEAKGLLGQVGRNRQVSGYLDKARTLYQSGKLAGALAAAAAGLAQAGDNSDLLALQDRIRRIDPLVAPLEEAEAMAQADDVNALLSYQKSCASVLTLEDDPLNALHRRAQDAASRISGKLVEAAQANAAKATDAIQGGDRVRAMSYFDLAVKANPADSHLADQRDHLYQQISGDCRKYYQEGIVHEDLGQSDLARESYRKVLAIGIPGEEYYRKAAAKLKTLDQ
jgi:pSer/pThr/pTyr-binding forkhead associated (FHA) protein